jgi:hypothetical protein
VQADHQKRAANFARDKAHRQENRQPQGGKTNALHDIDN